jgi:peroxin-16
MDQLRQLVSFLKNSTRNVHQDYTEWIKRNPNRASDIETSVKVISYLLHGRFKNNSTILPELLYCSSNLLAFWHDCLLKAEAERLTAAKAAYHHHSSKNGVLNSSGGGSGGGRGHRAGQQQVRRIKVVLTTLEYFEVFLEVSAKQLWGDSGRWMMILLIQSVK